MKISHVPHIQTHLLLVLWAMMVGGIAQAQQSNYYPLIQTGIRLEAAWAMTPKGNHTILNDDGVLTFLVDTKNSRPAFGLGMFMQFNIKDYLYLRPELLVQLSSRQAKLTDDSSGQLLPLESRHYSLAIPIVLGYHIDEWGFHAGIVLQNQLRSQAQDKGEAIYSIEGNYTQFTLGLGYQKDNWLLDLYYAAPLGEAEDKIIVDGSSHNISTRNSHIGLRIGRVMGGRE